MDYEAEDFPYGCAQGAPSQSMTDHAYHYLLNLAESRRENATMPDCEACGEPSERLHFGAHWCRGCIEMDEVEARADADRETCE